ncbi:lysophospholipid acyltransferase family protein [Thalassobacter stenotrophicus]|uniref:Acyltransferase n=2 Tax=Thalassobacter stenotrophicus TaxID=266809 RepID=A0A0P1EWT5_9RHOB|nr:MULTISPECIES: lysophospholipid acyltransferase family protein [Thalassobacter]KGK79937.1 acyltransferase [Thalassobacter stenotrophicus]KGL02560.1 acyltransferase [Thalassobacter sp. 16PALIMAR09]PVZ47790.1 acyltransferase [Thalassobacter stenotrophicus]UYP69018.1 lysophospholipid acyltransferase family protein [Thalassobacter stenotrophicus]CUH59536.1 Acyltransferase [Thalassobacter stenotrophicus]
MQSSSKHVARDISYSFSAQTRPGQAFIRSLENATGRLRLIKRADGYEREVGAGRDFWEVMVERYGLTLELLAGSLDNIPREGPLVVVANHPYGILDGLMMGHILSVVRGDFRILANRVFRKAEELNEVILPVSFDETKAGVALNLETRRTALKYLSDGGAIGVFPGGTVSTANKPFGRPLDPSWRSFTAKMIAKSDAHVVPIYFDGANSRLFQLASHLHTTLRMALLIKEFKSRVDAPVRLAVGQPLTRDALNPYLRDPRGMMDFLRAETYKLSSRPIDTSHYGFEFTEVHKPKSGQKNGHG